MSSNIREVFGQTPYNALSQCQALEYGNGTTRSILAARTGEPADRPFAILSIYLVKHTARLWVMAVLTTEKCCKGQVTDANGTLALLPLALQAAGPRLARKCQSRLPCTACL